MYVVHRREDIDILSRPLPFYFLKGPLSFPISLPPSFESLYRPISRPKSILEVCTTVVVETLSDDCWFRDLLLW